jgi:hypothetical protein
MDRGSKRRAMLAGATLLGAGDGGEGGDGAAGEVGGGEFDLQAALT